MVRIRGRVFSGLQRPRRAGVKTSWRGKPVIVHHTAGRVPKGRNRRELIADEKRVVREIQAQHFAQGWADIGYHIVIMPSGRKYRGRATKTIGAHAGTNAGNACPGVVIVGNYETTQPTEASLKAFRAVHAHLRRRLGVADRVVPHCDLSPTACPGKYLLRALGLR